MKTNVANVLVGFALALILLSLSLFIVDQRQTVIVFQLGEMVSVKTAPGLYFKVPLLQNVRYFDSRILTLDTGEPERFITAEKKNVMVDSFVKWRIVDVKQYYISVGGDEIRANTRLMQTVNSSMREEFGKRTIHEVVSGEREEIMNVLRNKGEGDAKASSIYAAAFGRNAEFYSFYRSLEAYKQSFKNKSDVMVMDPSSAFFKYLKSSGKAGK